jgi:hypothetical protein
VATSTHPRHGPVLPLPQPPSGPAVGIPDVALPVVGEGYEVQAEIAAAVHKSYGTDRPQYAHPAVGGIDYPAGTHQPRCGTPPCDEPPPKKRRRRHAKDGRYHDREHVNESGHGGPVGRVGTGRRVPGDGLRL